VGRVLVERSVMEQRFEAVMAVVRDGLPVVEVAANFGVSRQSVHAWIRRYEAGGVTALEDRSHQPFGCPHQTRLAWVLAKRGVEPAPSRSAV
jgi:transposase-like protein